MTCFLKKNKIKKKKKKSYSLSLPGMVFGKKEIARKKRHKSRV